MKKQEIFNILIIFIFSFSANYYYGSIGVFPIDTFAFFDSANFINKGFLPVRDYWTANGFFVDILQSFLFKLFGVNWITYLLHSSLLNFFLSFATYKFLIFKGLSFKSSLFYSVSVSILAYPSSGVPFPDHHSLILSVISMYVLIYSYEKKSNIFFSVSLIFLFFAFLSKQTPAGLFIILVAGYVFLYSISLKNTLFIKNFIITSFVFILLLIIFLLLSKTGIKNFLIQYILFPITIGEERSLDLTINSFISSLLGEFKFFLVVILIIIFQLLSKKNKNRFILDQTNIFFLILIFISLINQEIMKNQNMIFFLLPISFGIIHSNHKFFKDLKRKVFIFSVILLNAFVTLKYHERFNLDRKFMDLQNIDKSQYISGEEISKKLKGLKWVSLENQTYLKDEILLLKDSIEYLKKNKDNSIIISYYQFINSEIENNIYSPNRWYTDDGVSYPKYGNKYHEYYVNFYKNKLDEHKVKNIYTILPLDQKTFNFVLKSDCYKSFKINKLLLKHEILKCFAN